MSALAAPLVPAPSTGCRLVTPDGKALPFRGGTLTVRAQGGLARVVLTQRFVNSHATPLRVTYQVPLPADAAVAGFAFVLDGQRITGQLDRKQAARERFEEALLEGRTAALLEQDRSSLFTQEVGNVPPGAEVVCEVTLDQPLAWHGPTGGWSWRFPTVVAPRFLGAPGQVADAGRVTVEVATADLPPCMALRLAIGDVCTAAPRSPSHAIVVEQGDALEVSLGQDTPLDRDLVVRWPVAAAAAGATLRTGRAAEGEAAECTAGLLTLVPPAQAAAAAPRDLIVLLDTSGSMGGRPLRQAQAVTQALIDSLTSADQLQLVEFSTRVRSWKSGPTAAIPRNKAAASTWLHKLRAGGGTWMKDGILEALSRPRGEATRQVVLVTDGLIGFESEIVGEIANRLPRGCVVHTLGIGSGVNRSLLTPAARAGGGIEMIVGLDEDPAEAARVLVQATASPQVIDVEITGGAVRSVARCRVPDLVAGRPVRVAVALDPSGGPLTVRGATASTPWEVHLRVPPLAAGAGDAAVVALLGRETIEELEVRKAQGESVDAEVERVSLAYQVSSRMTSWVAVSDRQMVDPGQPTEAHTVPQALPYGLSAEGVGLRAAAPPPLMMRSAMPAALPAGAGAPPMQSAPLPKRSGRRRVRSAPPPMKADKARKKGGGGLFERIGDFFGGRKEESAGAAPPPPPMAFADDLDEELPSAPMPAVEEAEEPEGQDYASLPIQALDLIDAVRRRPEMYLGATRSPGLHEALDRLLRHLLHQSYGVTSLTVTLSADRRSVTIAVDGGGLPTAPRSASAEPALVALLLGTLGGPGGDQDLAIANAVSARLDLEVRQSGQTHQLRMRRGAVDEPLRVTGPATSTGTTLTLTPDRSVLGALAFDHATLHERLREVAAAHPGVDVRLNHAGRGTTETLPKGTLATVLGARVVLQRADLLVLEAEVEAAAIPWPPLAGTAQVLLDGTEHEATVDAARSTQPCTLQPGQRARITLTGSGLDAGAVQWAQLGSLSLDVAG